MWSMWSEMRFGGMNLPLVAVTLLPGRYCTIWMVNPEGSRKSKLRSPSSFLRHRRGHRHAHRRQVIPHTLRVIGFKPCIVDEAVIFHRLRIELDELVVVDLDEDDVVGAVRILRA